MKMCLKTSAIALFAASFFAAPAGASDLFDGLNDPAEQYQTQTDWSGAYIGGLVGYSLVNYELEAVGFPASFDGISGRGFQGCGIIGAQKQMGTIVFGLEGRGCGSNISTEATFGASSASLELDYSYAPYAKLGVAFGDGLASALFGYKWQHAESAALSFDDTIEGFSGGILLEHKLGDSGHWNLGFEMLYTQFEEQDATILNIDPTQYEGNIRLTYTIGQ